MTVRFPLLLAVALLAFACASSPPPEPVELAEAIRFGLATMAVSLGRSGGQASLPNGEDVEAFMVQSQPAVRPIANNTG